MGRARAMAFDAPPRSAETRRRFDAGLEHVAARPRAEEPLSLREREVLRLLPTELSNQELAAELYVSVNTVKSHLKTIYRKLGAQGRSDAVRRARELRLLPPRPPFS